MRTKTTTNNVPISTYLHVGLARKRPGYTNARCHFSKDEMDNTILWLESVSFTASLITLLVALLVLGCAEDTGDHSDDPIANTETSVDASESESGNVNNDIQVNDIDDDNHQEESMNDDGGESVGAFGEACTMDDPDACSGDGFCLTPFGNDGFCSKSCEVQNAACPTMPEGTYAACIIGEAGTPNGEKGCAFLCEGGGMTFDCPGNMVCESIESPPGSGQKLCMPPSIALML